MNVLQLFDFPEFQTHLTSNSYYYQTKSQKFLYFSKNDP